MISYELGQRILALRTKIVAQFNAGDWDEVGLLTGFSDLIHGHPRLLRSLSWGDEDYAGNALAVLRQIIERSPQTIDTLEQHVSNKYPDEDHYISARPAERRITFAPSVFQVPASTIVERDLVALMMPFDAAFDSVHQAIRRACTAAGYRCLRVDDIWEESAVIQDIFNLIFNANVVIVDFTGKNANVMYETGIAHTLGKHVVPLSQSLDDVPFDMKNHRVLKYLLNGEGLTSMESKLVQKLQQVSQ